MSAIQDSGLNAARLKPARSSGTFSVDGKFGETSPVGWEAEAQLSLVEVGRDQLLDYLSCGYAARQIR